MRNDTDSHSLTAQTPNMEIEKGVWEVAKGSARNQYPYFCLRTEFQV